MRRVTLPMGSASRAVAVWAGGAEEARAGTLFQPGDRFLEFFIDRLLGRGGVAEVYKILWRGRHYALKALQKRFHLDDLQTARAGREAQLLVQIRHENVVDVQDAGIDDGIFWMRMELLEGRDLREAMHRIGPMSVALACGWLRQAAHGAHQCHALGVVHRDIKPENIFLVPPAQAKLLDFGIAKIIGDMRTLEGGTGQRPAPVGTAPYMSSEQVCDGKITPASDVYALGMTFWEMVMGYHPFLPEGVSYDYWAMLRKQVHVEVPKLSGAGFPEYLSRVIARALAKDPRERQPNGLVFAEELLDACQRYADEHPDEDTQPGEPALAWLLGDLDEPPSFGTGPSSGPRVRRSGPIPTGPAPRFSSAPPPEPMDRDTDPDPMPPEPMDRDTDPTGVPLEIRRFDTISMPPELRDPTAVEALARYRPRGAGKPHWLLREPPPAPKFNAPPLDPLPHEGRVTTLPPPPLASARLRTYRPREVALWVLLVMGWAIALVLLYLRIREGR